LTDLRKAIQEIYSHAVEWEEKGLVALVTEWFDLLEEKYPWLNKSFEEENDGNRT
jgi:hypothetical protein